MREPKYQAYLTDENRMVQVTTLNLIKNTKGEHEYLSVGFYLDGEGKFEGTGFVLSEAILRQYTGLKDKNGKEIYEGDIVNVTPFEDKPQYEEVGFYTTRSYVGLNPFTHSPDGSPANYCEVVGNIYENPELLK